MVDPGSVSQNAADLAKQGRRAFWAGIVVALIASGTSIVLQAWNVYQTHAEQEAASRASKRFAYMLFVSEAASTSYALQDLVDCQYILDSLESPPKAASDAEGAQETPTSVGFPSCSGLAPGKGFDLSDVRQAVEQAEAKWTKSYGQLAEPREEMIRYADRATNVHVEEIYRALGNPHGFDHKKVTDNISKVESELCRELPEEC